MLRAIRIAGCVHALLSCLLFSQQPSNQQATNPTGRPTTVRVKATDAGRTADKTPKLTDDQKLALQLLETSEAASRGFEAPMRSYGLMNVAQSLTGLDQARAQALLRDAFRASLEIHDDDYTRDRMQQEILRSLLPLSQADVEELLPQAGMQVRKPITDIIVGRYAEKKQFDKGLELVNQISALDEFPYNSGGKLMEAMPPEMMAEKQGLFSQALTSFKAHERQPNRITLGDDSLTGLVVKFGNIMPPKMVLAAIDEILAQDKKLVGDQLNITVGGDGGTASFASRYQYDLFSVLPVLRQLDESRAKQLLEENQTLQDQVQRYPQGLNSLNPPPPPPQPGAKEQPASRGLSTMVRRGGPGPGHNPGPAAQSNAAAQAYMNQEAQRKAQEIAQEGETDPTQAIAHAMTLPATLDGMSRNSPRAGALEAIAKANVKKNPGAANQALSELRKTVGDLKLNLQAQYLASAAGIYLQMGDKDNSEKIVGDGFKIAEKMLDKDVNPDNPNQALKAWWPSADAYRRFVEVEAKISYPATMNVLKEIKDGEIRTTESINFARTLIGLPLKRFMVQEKRQDMNMTFLTDSD
jgi:hypothetical protein